MQETDDIGLLRQYAEHNAEEAFAALVARHVNLVYSVALRHVGNSHQAEEVTQAVFVILARKARNLGNVKILSGWLFHTARLTAANFVRSEMRRARREQEAHMQSLLNQPESEVWPQIAPLLDTAVAGLSEKDRDAIVLRFFEGKNFREVGVALGASEDAAAKRVNRALEKLRQFFTRRGVVLSATALATTVSANSVQAAPVGLAASAAAATAKGAVISSSMLTLIKGALKIMAWTKAKTAVVVGVVVVLATGTTVVAVKGIAHGPSAETFQKESISRINGARQLGLACVIFADAHNGLLPGDIATARSTVRRQFATSPLNDSDFEMVSTGKLSGIKNPDRTILVREKRARKGPDGKFVKAYGFADGHAELMWTTDGDFDALEKQRELVIERPMFL